MSPIEKVEINERDFYLPEELEAEAKHSQELDTADKSNFHLYDITRIVQTVDSAVRREHVEQTSTSPISRLI